MISEIYSKLQQSDPTLGLLSEIHTHYLKKNIPNAFRLRDQWGPWSSIAADQWALHEKALEKAPEWVAAGCLFERRSLEQCTSTAVARAKADFFSALIPHMPIHDLCAGFGIDAWAWSLTPRPVTAVEIDPALHNLALCNLSLNPHPVTRVCGDAEDHWQSHREQIALFMADPDRRDGSTRLGAQWDLYRPHIWPWIEDRKPGQHWLIKLSPMTDLSALRSQIDVEFDAYFIAFEAETKELLVHVHDQAKQIVDVLICSKEGRAQSWTALLNEPFQAGSQSYLFEPHGAAFAARLNRHMPPSFEPLTRGHGFFKVPFLVSAQWGRCYALVAHWEGSLNSIGQELKRLGIQGASITVRESRLSADSIRKKWGLRESQNQFVFVSERDRHFSAWLVRR
ncbi:MAG: THUMP-like domain-containing protein [Bacteroidia bacterium]